MIAASPDVRTADAHLAGVAFDTVAATYDSTFTTSLIGRAQRSAVWAKAAQVFRKGDRVLELNCGTGEDALFLARRGISVTACDASARMIEQARSRVSHEPPAAPIEFHTLCTEQLGELNSHLLFDGVFSNFSGLNCVENIPQTARLISARLKSGAQLLLCLSTRFCLWEIFYYSLHGNLRKAFRRCNGVTAAKLGSHSFPVYYPTLRSLLQWLGPEFRFLSVTGIGVVVPPSYLESWACRHPRTLGLFESIDKVVSGWPVLRVLSDHMLVHLERV